jgi:DNA-3-methyladenine glycosylase I
MKTRCEWPKEDSLMNHYHDHEWGNPLHDNQKLFEFMVLDAFQAGLSWKTILHRRENFRKAFSGFNVDKIAKYTDADFDRLMNDAGIIRNRMKIKATINNAIAFKKVQKEFGSFDCYIWKFVNNKTLHNKWKAISEIPPRSLQSDEMSKDLKKRGFSFVGSTICYSFMQAAGMVNDHVIGCYRYGEIKKIK